MAQACCPRACRPLQVALAVHHRLDAPTIVGLLQGTCCSGEGEEGAQDVTMYVSLAGAMALRWVGRWASCLGRDLDVLRDGAGCELRAN
jgi:hypothetical protein